MPSGALKGAPVIFQQHGTAGVITPAPRNYEGYSHQLILSNVDPSTLYFVNSTTGVPTLGAVTLSRFISGTEWHTPYFQFFPLRDTNAVPARALVLVRQGGQEHVLVADLSNPNYVEREGTLAYGMTPVYEASSFPNLRSVAEKASTTPSSPLLNSIPFEDPTIFFDGCPTTIAPCYSAFSSWSSKLCRRICGGYSPTNGLLLEQGTRMCAM